MLQPGQKAPDFSLYDTEKNKKSLQEYKGQNLLLLFFPLAFTSVCTKELCSIRDDIWRYNQLNVQVFGISVDSIYTLAHFREEQKLNFPLLSDFNKTVSHAYDSLYQTFGFEMSGVSKRAAFVIDKEGIIRHVEVLENAGELPDFHKINTTLDELTESQ